MEQTDRKSTAALSEDRNIYEVKLSKLIVNGHFPELSRIFF